jgi:acylphosphatase
MQARIYVLGFVQNVGFRGFVKSNAQKLNLKGWVQNTDDGRLEMVAQGSKDDIQKLIKICEKGPIISNVKSVVVNWEKEERFENFETY